VPSPGRSSLYSVKQMVVLPQGLHLHAELPHVVFEVAFTLRAPHPGSGA